MVELLPTALDETESRKSEGNYNSKPNSRMAQGRRRQTGTTITDLKKAQAGVEEYIRE